jgi:hypothetical protein
MTPQDQSVLLGFMEAMCGLSKVGQALTLAQRISKILGRQYYGITGMIPGEAGMSAMEKAREMARLGVGERGAAEELAKARQTGRDIPSAQARLEASREKLDTAPGFLRGLATKPGRTISLGWKSHTPVGKFIIGTAPAVPVYGAVTGKDLRPGETTAGRVAEEAGRTLGFGVTGTLPFLPGVGAGMAAGKAGKVLVESLSGK